MENYGFELNIVKKLEVFDMDFAIDTMWYDIEEGQLIDSDQNWKSLKNVNGEPLTNAAYRNDPNKTFD
jgi:hypothetical protein